MTKKTQSTDSLGKKTEWEKNVMQGEKRQRRKEKNI